ncbi:MAG: hypothetical protein FWG17_05550 [Desulfovibrionaceae bacterium]|nr:hypothetical protein [Desulfovibrionaceae bacterium]
MSKSLFDARRKIHHVHTLLRQNSVVNAVESLHSGLQDMLGEPLLKSERKEFERMLDEAVQEVMSDQKVKDFFQAPVNYQPGKEHELLAHLRTLMESMVALAADEAEKEIKRQETLKRDQLAEGVAALVDKRKDRAEEIFNTLAKEYEEDAALMVNIAEAYEQLSHLDEALVYLEKAVQLDAASAYLHNKCGILHRKKRNFASAEKFFHKALSITPDNPNIYFNSGRLYVDWEKWAETYEHAKKALELQPDFHEAHMMAEYAQKRLR